VDVLGLGAVLANASIQPHPIAMSARSSYIFALFLAAVGCTVSDQQEVAIGEQDAEQINAQLPLLDDPRVVGYVQKLGQAIAAKTSRADLTWHFYVVNTEDVNAFALPGGFVYVNRGLIEQSQRLDQLAGTLGHEIGHVVRRHAVEQKKKQTGANIGISLACTLTKICQHTSAQVVISAAGSALFAKYSRRDESEADSEAVVNVVNAGIDPRGIPELFQILLRERERSPTRLDAFFASHPLEESRIAATEQQIAELPQPSLGRLTADDAAFHGFKDALAALPAAPKLHAGGQTQP
jgi:predicted Zn-dependent protease